MIPGDCSNKKSNDASQRAKDRSGNTNKNVAWIVLDPAHVHHRLKGDEDCTSTKNQAKGYVLNYAVESEFERPIKGYGY